MVKALKGLSRAKDFRLNCLAMESKGRLDQPRGTVLEQKPRVIGTLKRLTSYDLAERERLLLAESAASCACRVSSGRIQE
jgi:hypothetical protein